MVSLAARREAAAHLQTAYEVSERRTCQILDIPRSSKRYESRTAVSAAQLIEMIWNLSLKYPRFGYRKIHWLLKDAGVVVGRERVRVIRRQEGLKVVKKPKKKRPAGMTTQAISLAQRPHHVWSYDFVHDQTMDGRTLKCLTVVDEFTRQALCVNVRRSFTSDDVIRALSQFIGRWGAPTVLRSDNGPEFIAKGIEQWLRFRRIDTHFIDPGSPWQNGYNESFNGVLRDGCLDRWSFQSLAEARSVIESFVEEYNTIRPHGSLGGRSPSQFMKDWEGEHLSMESAA